MRRRRAARIPRKELKQKAQDELMFGLQSAFTFASDSDAPREVLDEMSRQMARIEKLFGYNMYSWERGV